MSNAIDKSPVTLVADSLLRRIPSAPPGPFSKIGAKGNLFTATDGTTHYALAETGSGDFAFCWFEQRERRDTAVRCKSAFQVPVLDGEGRALVIGSGGELFVVRPDGVAESLGRLPDGVRATRAAWTRTGFAVGEDDAALHLYRWTPGTPPVGIGRYTAVPCSDLRRCGEVGDLLLACDMDHVAIVAIDDVVRVVARFELAWHTTSQCTDESGRHLWILPPDHISDGGGQFRIEGLQPAWDRRAEFPEVTRDGEAAPLTAGGVTTAPPVQSAAIPATAAPLTARRATGRHVRALMDMLAARKLGERAPDVAIAELLAFPMDDDLYAYLHFRATHADPGVIAIYEAWLDAPPRRVTDAYALGEGTDAIELGILANGDRVVAVFGVPGERYHLAELSHEEREARPFRSLEHWLGEVCMRTEAGTDLDPYLG